MPKEEEENKDKYNKVQPQASVQKSPKKKVELEKTTGEKIEVEPDTVSGISKFGNLFVTVYIMNDYTIMVKGTILSVAEKLWKE